MKRSSEMFSQTAVDVIGSNEDKFEFQKFLKENNVPFNFKLKESVDPTAFTLGLLTALTPMLIRLFYDYTQGRKDKGFRLVVHIGKEAVEISARTTPKDLEVIIREKLKK